MFCDLPYFNSPIDSGGDANSNYGNVNASSRPYSHQPTSLTTTFQTHLNDVANGSPNVDDHWRLNTTEIRIGEFNFFDSFFIKIQK